MLGRLIRFILGIPEWDEDEIAELKQAFKKIDEAGDEIVIHKNDFAGRLCIERRKKRVKKT